MKIGKQNGLIFVVAGLYALLSACSSGDHQAKSSPTSGFEPGGIEIRYRADKMLNEFDNKAHTLVLVVYQLSDAALFQEFTLSNSGLKKLLASEHFDASAVFIKRYIIQPGESKKIILDRVENVRWIGLVAGYYNLDDALTHRLFEIPVITEETGWIFKKRSSRLDYFLVNLYLGPHAIHRVGEETEGEI
jgi:type VI secretion system VasD/TssJ family lipoprotein